MGPANDNRGGQRTASRIMLGYTYAHCSMCAERRIQEKITIGTEMHDCERKRGIQDKLLREYHNYEMFIRFRVRILVELVENEIHEQERRKHRNIIDGYISLFPDFTCQS